MKYSKILIFILVIILIFNIFNVNFKENFTTNSALPNIISTENFDQYFVYDSGISNCRNGTGCPSNPKDYITNPGTIIWKNGQSATFRTKNPVLPSGEGFVGFKLNSVPMGQKIWNSIWLMGKNAGRAGCGPCLEIDIYELNNTWWGNNGTSITVPKISFHDWPSGNGAMPKNNQGCFGVMLSGSVGGWDNNTKSMSHCGGEIIKNWNWNSVKSQIYNGATWYTLVTKDNNNKPLVYVGISLKGWLPKNKNEYNYANVLANSDFLVSSGVGNIDGDPKGGFFFCLTSTSNDGSSVSGEWKIPEIVHYDGLSSSTGGSTPQSTTGSTPQSTSKSTPQSTTGSTPLAHHTSTAQSTTGSTPLLHHSSTSQSTTGSTPLVHHSSTSQSTFGSTPIAHDSSTLQSTTASTTKMENDCPSQSTTISPSEHNQNTTNNSKNNSTCYSTMCKVNKDSGNEGTIGHLVNPGNISFDECKQKCDDDINCNYFKSGPGQWCEKFYDNKFPNKNSWELFINNNNIPKFKSKTGNELYYTGLPSKYCCN